ncbi:MAG: D-alanine--D-alanine ligase family protein [Patescibacteria group bacterium]
MKKNILILFGGQSGEHEVSLKSAASVIAHLDRQKYNLMPLCISKTGQWLNVEESIKYLTASTDIKSACFDIKACQDFDISKSLIAPRNQKSQNAKIDVVFPVLHGPYGEDGTVQGFLELWGVPFVGSDTLSSALAMDKAMAKKIFQAEKIPTAKYRIVNKDNLTQILPKINLPSVVKPVNLGSSVGVAIVKQKKDLLPALKSALKIDRKGEALVEKFITGLELTVPILGDQALPVIEIKPKRKGDWFDYKVKYDPNLVDELTPAPSLSKAQTKKAQKLALRAHQALKCRHISRVDMILADDGKFYVLEVNTIPGLTAASLLPKSAQAAGLSFGQLLDRLIKVALSDKL